MALVILGRGPGWTKEERVKSGYNRAKKVLDAAVAILDVEARWSAGGSSAGATKKKRELEAAVSDYLDHHSGAEGHGRVPSTRRKP
jgi:hypothetical protein